MTYKKQKKSTITILRRINIFLKQKIIDILIKNHFIFINNVLNKNKIE